VSTYFVVDTSCQCRSGSPGSLNLTWHEIPGQQFADAADEMVGDAGEHDAEIEFRIEAVELGRADDRIESYRSLAARVGTGEQIVFVYGALLRAILPHGSICRERNRPCAHRVFTSRRHAIRVRGAH
jgi:hypothetical protein